MGQASSANDNQSDTDVFISNYGGDSPGRGNSRNKRFKHPMAALFHVLFKSLAILFYLFGGIFGQNFISTFVSVILLISMDFWVVKNVTGRLLAGLRWSNFIDDEGNSHWIFENKNTQRANQNSLADDQLEENESNQTADASIFWTGLIVAPTFWTLFMLVSIFKFNIQWLMLVVLASVLSLSNLYGYVRCRLGSQDLKSSVTQFVAKQVFLNFITGGSTSSSNKPMA